MTASNASRGVATTVGANIRAGRKAKNMTQGDLARALDLRDAMAVSRWERGLHVPNTVSLIALATLLFDGNVGALYAEPVPARDAA